MELSPNQIKEAKKQLIEQINSSFPEDKKQESIEKINLMDDNQFLDFLKENNLISSENSPKNQTKCIFCSIVAGEIPSTKIEENNSAVAILEINPISYGHAIVVPKNHTEKKEDLNQETINLAEKIKQDLEKTFSPKKVELVNQTIMGHEVINVLPIYENETINSPKKQASKKDLEKIKQDLEKLVSKTPESKKPPQWQEDRETPKKEEINEKNTWLPKRFP